MKLKQYKIMSFSIIGALAAVFLAVSIVLGVLFSIYKPFLVKTHPIGEGATIDRAVGDALSVQAQEEGTVMVKNGNKNNGTGLSLPLDKAAVDQVNVFGWSATNWVHGGSGSGQVTNYNNNMVDLLGALGSYDLGDGKLLKYNTALIDNYRSYQRSREKTAALNSFNYEFSKLYEPAMDNKTVYSDDVLADAKDFSDTAIVVISRVSGESNDSPKKQYKKEGTDEDRTYLEISTEEEALLTYVGANYDNVIVLINAVNVMELGFLNDIPGLDSCLVVAGTGTGGAKAIPEILYGDVTPSGKLVDTYAYDLSTNPSYVNTGSGNDTTNFYTNSMYGAGIYPAISGTQHTNGSSNVNYAGAAYTDYQEGIYIGYKWYETADKEGFWTSPFAKGQWGVNGYDDVVQYPFGYGLSYTTFDWTVTGVPNNLSVTADTIDDEITFKVTVKNTGAVSGQDVVELYAEPPYTPGGVEKSAVNLVAFAKTPIALDANGSAEVSLTFKARDLASYDYENKSGLVQDGGYVLEKGNYTLTFKTDSHNAKSGVNTFTLNVGKDIAITEDESGGTISNKFTGENAMDGVAIDGNSDHSAGNTEIVYMTRNAFESTFPTEQAENRAMTDAVKKYNLFNATLNNEWEAAHSDAAPIITGTVTAEERIIVYSSNKITEIGKQLGLDYDDGNWDDVLNQVTLTEMTNVALHGYAKTREINSIGKPVTKDLDGPNQIGSFSNINGTPTGFNSIIIAQTWNVEIAYSLGKQIGQDATAGAVNGWYGPGINIHRSPFGGRNFEYYSEDPLITGLMCANAVEGARYAGVFSYLKHLALYETESGRDGMYVWTTEQALREIYLKPFEIAIKHKDRWGINDSGATGIMTSYGRVGAVWAGGSPALLSNDGVLRGEWGFHGAILTDYADHHNFMNGDHMIRAGGDLWMDGAGNNGSFDFGTSSNAVQQELRRSTKNVVYMWLNALATNEAYVEGVNNGTIDDTAVTSPGGSAYDFDWTILVTVLFTVAWVAGLGVWLILVILKKDKKKPQLAEANATEATSGDSGEEAKSEEADAKEAQADEADADENKKE